MKDKFDDENNNAESVECNIEHTLENIRRDQERIDRTHSDELKEQLRTKNERRKENLEALRSQIDETEMDR